MATPREQELARRVKTRRLEEVTTASGQTFFRPIKGGISRTTSAAIPTGRTLGGLSKPPLSPPIPQIPTGTPSVDQLRSQLFQQIQQSPVSFTQQLTNLVNEKLKLQTAGLETARAGVIAGQDIALTAREPWEGMPFTPSQIRQIQGQREAFAETQLRALDAKISDQKSRIGEAIREIGDLEGERRQNNVVLLQTMLQQHQQDLENRRSIENADLQRDLALLNAQLSLPKGQRARLGERTIEGLKEPELGKISDVDQILSRSRGLVTRSDGSLVLDEQGKPIPYKESRSGGVGGGGKKINILDIQRANEQVDALLESETIDLEETARVFSFGGGSLEAFINKLASKGNIEIDGDDIIDTGGFWGSSRTIGKIIRDGEGNAIGIENFTE